MRTSISRAVILLTAFSVFTGLLLYPAGATCTRILKDDQVKSLDPSEPDINCAEPGNDPDIRILGSNFGTSVESPQQELPDSGSSEKKIQSRYIRFISLYLRNFTNGCFVYW